VSVQLWLSTRSVPQARKAAAFENMGWDGLAFTESQNRSGDPFVALTVAALTTTRIGLGVAVTNPTTRHPAITAAAAMAVQAESGGRLNLGIGRGDSALAHIGVRPAPVALLRSFVANVQAHLHGQAPGEDWAWPAESGPPPPKVPVFVAASAPKSIQVAAEHADRVMLAVGADPLRLRWAIDLVHAVRPDVPIGAFVNVVVNDSAEVALKQAGGRIATFARFSAMHGQIVGPVTEPQREVLDGLAADFQMTMHGLRGAHTERLTPEFAERFAVLGPSGYCLDRLLELAALGIDRFHIIGPTPEFEREARRRFVAQVMTPLRDGT
jgi:5,10-methylenetetrahydromethanopterin reductase